MTSDARLRSAGVAFLVALCSLTQHPTVSGQGPDLAGERVRLTLLDESRMEGVVTNSGSQGVALRTDSDSLVTPEWSDVLAAERLTTRRRSMRGLGLGLLAGGLGTAVVAGIAIDPCEGDSFCVGPSSRGEAAAVFGLIGAVAGGVAGLLIGTAITTSSWEPIVVPGGLADGAAALALRWRP